MSRKFKAKMTEKGASFVFALINHDAKPASLLQQLIN
jgi:hypothetical protein